jgi:hypothetical protein
MCTEDIFVSPYDIEEDALSIPPALVVGPYAFPRDGIKLHLQREGIPVVGEFAATDQVLNAVHDQKPDLVFFEDGATTFGSVRTQRTARNITMN